MSCRSSLLYALTGVLCLVLPRTVAAETLRDAVGAALVSHPGLEIAAARKDISTAAEAEEFSNLFPQINTSATGGRMFGNNSTSRGLTVSRGEAYSWLWEGNASITQPIFNGFETYNRIDAAEARSGAAEYTMADAKQGIALRAAQAFLNVMRAQEAYAKTTSYQDKIKDYLSRINSMVEGGAADESEAAQAKNIQSMLENTVAEMDGQVKLALADYNEAVGSMPAGELKNDNSASVLPYKNVDEALGFATGNHPLIMSAQKSLDAEDEEVSADIGSMMPKLDGELSYLKRDQKEEIGGEVEDGRAVMRLNWGFSTGGGQLAKIRKSKAERSEALARIAQTQREIERDVRRAFVEYETASKQRDLAVKRTSVTKDLFNTYEKQFEASKVRLLQLMQAENQLFTAELEQINANYRVTMAEYAALASMGNLIGALHLDSDTQNVSAQTVVQSREAKPQAEATSQDVYPQNEIATSAPAGK